MGGMDRTAFDVMCTARVLRRVRERLTPDGAWCQGIFSGVRDGKRSHCLASAMAVGHIDYGCFSGCFCPYCSAVGAIRNEVHAIHPDLLVWNDAPERTQAEVLDLLDRAIVAIEAGAVAC